MVLIRGSNRKAASTKASIGGSCFRKRIHPRLCSGEEGTALIEIAMVMPILLMLLLGIFSFGIALNNQLTLTQAVGAGAQYLQQLRSNTTDPCADTFTKVTSAAPYLNSTEIVVTVTMNGTTPSQMGNSCSGAQTNLTQRAPITVAATYPCNLTVYGVNFAPTCLFHAQVTEYEY